jgi:hypothetical protein
VAAAAAILFRRQTFLKTLNKDKQSKKMQNKLLPHNLRECQVEDETAVAIQIVKEEYKDTVPRDNV